MWRQCSLPGSRAHWIFWADRRAVWRSPRPCKALNLLIPAIWLAALRLLLRPRLRALHLLLALHLGRPLSLWQPQQASPLVQPRLRPRPHRPRPVLAPLRVRLLSPPLVYPRCVALQPRPRLLQARLLQARLLLARLLLARLFRARVPQLRLAKPRQVSIS